MTQIKFSDESLKLVQELIARYPEGRQKSALIPVLHIAQAEFDGWLSAPVMDYVASLLKLQPIRFTKSPRSIPCSTSNRLASA